VDKTIRIIIEEDGAVGIEATGYTGGSCVKATQPLKDTLIGEKPESQEFKPEFRLPEQKIAERIKQ
jgi:hypothetical protein